MSSQDPSPQPAGDGAPRPSLDAPSSNSQVSSRRVVLAADHAGVELKAMLVEHLTQRGIEAVDLGPQSTQSVDYPDFAHAVAQQVRGGDVRGVLVCGTGVGMAMAANRWRGVRAVNCTDLFTARMAREHNDANVLALGARVVGAGLAIELLETFLDTPFAGDRHARRVGKIDTEDR